MKNKKPKRKEGSLLSLSPSTFRIGSGESPQIHMSTTLRWGEEDLLIMGGDKMLITPENKTRVSILEAVEKFHEGHRILVECYDGDFLYAVHLFSKGYGHTEEDVMREQEYIAKGIWYVLNE
jgi:hypothetical protein